MGHVDQASNGLNKKERKRNYTNISLPTAQLLNLNFKKAKLPIL